MGIVGFPHLKARFASLSLIFGRFLKTIAVFAVDWDANWFSNMMEQNYPETNLFAISFFFFRVFAFEAKLRKQ